MEGDRGRAGAENAEVGYSVHCRSYLVEGSVALDGVDLLLGQGRVRGMGFTATERERRLGRERRRGLRRCRAKHWQKIALETNY